MQHAEILVKWSDAFGEPDAPTSNREENTRAFMVGLVEGLRVMDSNLRKLFYYAYKGTFQESVGPSPDSLIRRNSAYVLSLGAVAKARWHQERETLEQIDPELDAQS